MVDLSFYAPILADQQTPMYYSKNSSNETILNIKLLFQMPILSGINISKYHFILKSLNTGEVFGQKTYGANSSAFQLEPVSGSDTYKIANFTLNTNKNQNQIYRDLEGRYFRISLGITGSLEDKPAQEIGTVFSTTRLIKVTGKSTLDIDLGPGREIKGTYSNTDKTEYLYSSIFYILNESQEIIEQSEELLYNFKNYTNNNRYYQTYKFKSNIAFGEFYTVKWEVKTSTGAKYTQVSELFTNNEIYAPDCWLIPYVQYDSEEGRNIIEIRMKYPNSYSNLDSSMNLGNYEIRRYNLNSKNKLFKEIIVLNNLLPQDLAIPITSNGTNYSYNDIITHPLFYDYDIEFGQKYIYSISQRNKYNAFSAPSYGNSILTDFEHIYLYGLEEPYLGKQFKIKYNPKISGYKNVVQESKIDTIGSQYPFIFRNKATKYKEFSISGLISYLGDEQNLSGCEYSSDNDYFSIGLNTENFQKEREYREYLLEALNSGKKWLFKSPAEGNKIIRLMNISLTPNDQLSRMLYTFTATAIEIEDYNSNIEIYSQLIDYSNSLIYYNSFSNLVDNSKTIITINNQTHRLEDLIIEDIGIYNAQAANTKEGNVHWQAIEVIKDNNGKVIERKVIMSGDIINDLTLNQLNCENISEIKVTNCNSFELYLKFTINPKKLSVKQFRGFHSRNISKFSTGEANIKFKQVRSQTNEVTLKSNFTNIPIYCKFITIVNKDNSLKNIKIKFLEESLHTFTIKDQFTFEHKLVEKITIPVGCEVLIGYIPILEKDNEQQTFV